MLNRKNKIEPYYTSSAADLLQETMADFNITQADLAKRIGISQKSVSSILNRKTFMNEKTALKLEKVLGISSTLLLNLDNNFKAEKPVHQLNSEKSRFNNPNYLKPYNWVQSYEN